MKRIDVAWAGSGSEGAGHLVGRPDARLFVLNDAQTSAMVRDFRPVPADGLAETLAAAVAGDAVTPALLAKSDVIAFEHNGNQPAPSGGWESCDWSFSDGVRSVSVRWDQGVDPSGAPVARDPHVMANGTITGSAYATLFGVPIPDLMAQNPSAASPDLVRISFLLIRVRDDLDVRSPDFEIRLDLSSATPDVDAIGVLNHYTDIGIYTGRLTYTWFSIPGVTTEPVNGSDTVELPLRAGTYGFSQSTGPPAFTFEVTAAGTIDYDQAFDGFLQGRGSTKLTVLGHPVGLDATNLSHDLRPAVVGATGLTRQRMHWLQLVPASGYGFIPAEDRLADFRFDVRADGAITVDPAYAGFAGVSGDTLTIKGYAVTIDARGLSEDLVLVSMIGPVDPLPHGVVNVRTFIPAAGYLLRSAGISAARFGFAVTTSGAVHPA